MQNLFYFVFLLSILNYIDGFYHTCLIFQFVIELIYKFNISSNITFKIFSTSYVFSEPPTIFLIRSSKSAEFGMEESLLLYTWVGWQSVLQFKKTDPIIETLRHFAVLESQKVSSQVCLSWWKYCDHCSLCYSVLPLAQILHRLLSVLLGADPKKLLRRIQSSDHILICRALSH